MSVSCDVDSDDNYLQATNEYIFRVRHYSPMAADCIEQIQRQYGVRAAYLAGFALMILKDRLNRRGYPSLSNALKTFSYYDEMQANPGAIRLYEEAAEHLLSAQ